MSPGESTPAVPGPQPSEILELTHKLQMDLNAAQAKLVTLRSLLASLPDSERTYDHVCRHDGLKFRTADRLCEHLENVHGQ